MFLHARLGEKIGGAVTQDVLACPLGGKIMWSGNARESRVPARRKNHVEW